MPTEEPIGPCPFCKGEMEPLRGIYTCKGCGAISYRRKRARGPLPIRHGTITAYSNRKCRCPACKEASAKYMRGYRAKWKVP